MRSILMKHLYMILFMLCLSISGFAQANKVVPAAAETLAKQAPKVANNISSKLLRSRYLMSVQSINTLQQVHAQQVAAVFANNEVELALRTQVISQLKEQAAVSLAELTAQMDKEYAQWADALLRERDPHFLPKKDPAIPGLLAWSPDTKQAAHLTPRFFREWTATIPDYEELPEEVSGLVFALRKRLATIETEIFQAMQSYMKAKMQLNPTDNFNANRFYRKQMAQANRTLLRLSKESAQCVADLVSILNLYPSLFKNSMILLAAKLDGTMQTEFTEYIRKQIDVPVQKATAPVGFNYVQKGKPDRLQGTIFNGFKK